MGRSGLEKLYLRYCYELGILPRYNQDPSKVHTLLKDDLLMCDRYSKQAKLLSMYHVSTDEDLAALSDKLQEKITDLSSKREELRLKSRRVLPESETGQAKADARELTAEIHQLRHELKLCGEIKERSGHVRENLEAVDRDRQREHERDRN